MLPRGPGNVLQARAPVDTPAALFIPVEGDLYGAASRVSPGEFLGIEGAIAHGLGRQVLEI